MQDAQASLVRERLEDRLEWSRHICLGEYTKLAVPGQETRNSDFLLENGAAIKAPSIAALPGKVSALLSRPGRLDKMGESALALGRPRAAYEVARGVLQLAGAGGRSALWRYAAERLSAAAA